LNVVVAALRERRHRKSIMAHHDWLGLKQELPHRRKVTLMVLSFLVPLALWSALSYIPGLWHPLVHVTDVGSVDYFVTDKRRRRARRARICRRVFW